LQTVGRSWRIHLLTILAYTLLALALTWPLAAHLGTHVPGDGADDPPLTWNLWWLKHALLELGTNPFDCSQIFYPLGINLAFYTLTVLNGLLSIPLQAVFGLICASNLLLLSSFVLSGYGASLLTAYLLNAEGGRQEPDGTATTLPLHLAAFTAGLLYAFASSKLFYAALGQWNIASSQWIPFFVLYLVKMAREPGHWRHPFLAALFLLLQAYAELTYATFLVLFTALWFVWYCAARWHDIQLALPRFTLNLLLIGCIFAIGLVPVLANMVPDMLAEGDIFVEGGGFADVFSADLLGFFVPTMHHPFLGSLVQHFDFDHNVGQHLYVGYSVLALTLVAVIGWWQGRYDAGTGRRRHVIGFWLLSALAFWLLTLGPSLRINGHDTGLPLPFALVARLPFFEGNRYPSRYSVLLVLSLAVLVAFGMHQLLGRAVSGRWRTTAKKPGPSLLVGWLMLSAIMQLEHTSAPLPLSEMRIPPVYDTIADEMPGDFTLLDLPVAWRNGFRVTGTQHPIIMFEQYYQTTHGKRILAGNTSRNPPLKFQYFTEAPVISSLIALETGHRLDAATVDRDRAIAADVLRFFGVEAIVVHPAQTGPEMIPYLEATMPIVRFYEDAETVAYRVDLPPLPKAWSVEPGDSLGRLSYAEGWGIASSGVIWAQRRSARLLVLLDGQRQQMAFRAYAPDGGQRMRLEINGQPTSQIALGAGWQDYLVLLPAEAVHPGLNEILLRFEALYPADLARLSPRTIDQTDIESPVNVVVQSAGQEVGDFGHVYVNGQQVSPNGRGYNLVVIDPQTGKVDTAVSFDTHLDKRASQALATFLQRTPSGHIVALAAADEASQALSQEAVAALDEIGATGDLRGRFRWGHAAIGVKGAPPGSAHEALDWMQPVTLVVGEGTTEPTVAAAFATMTFTATNDP
jgi:hypothetical protein